jgi:predicted DNA-binding protein with PD1-like motif
MSLAIHACRFPPGTDLRAALSVLPREQGFGAGFILSAVGSLSRVRLRFAGQETAWAREGDFEILTLSGTLGPDGPHLHMSVADADGAVVGGHVLDGCVVRTTAEIVVGVAADWRFRREFDPATGYRELRADKR